MLIKTKRFVLRPLTVGDVTERYAQWLRDSTAQQYIVSASSQQSVASIRQYVAERENREDVLFLGIFTADGGLHIGNIKFEPLDRQAGEAVMGILIGDTDWRGRGVTPEVLEACGEWLYANRGVSRIVLGVGRDNLAAIRAYEKAGFEQVARTDGKDALKMVRHHRPRQSRLALGSVQFGMRYGVANTSGQVAMPEIKRILACAGKAGIDTIDTAIAYGDSEANLGMAGVSGWSVVSKLPPVPDSCPDAGQWVEQSVAASLERLKLPALHGLLLHRPSDLTGVHGKALYAALMKLKERGLVRKTGLSVYGPQELDELIPKFAIDLVQAPFNVLDRRLDSSGWLSRLKQQGIEVHTRSAFLQGLLLMPAVRREPKFDRWRALWNQWETWLATDGLTPLQACLGFVLDHKDIDRVVIGVDTADQLAQTLRACESVAVNAPPALHSEDTDLINPANWARLQAQIQDR